MATWIWALIWFLTPIAGLTIGTAIAFLTKAEVPLVVGLVVMVIGVLVMLVPNISFVGGALLLAGAGICWGTATSDILKQG